MQSDLGDDRHGCVPVRLHIRQPARLRTAADEVRSQPQRHAQRHLSAAAAAAAVAGTTLKRR